MDASQYKDYVLVLLFMKYVSDKAASQKGYLLDVEVKSHISGDDELVRGFFQCVKYHAVLEAFLLSTGRTPNVRTLLVITRKLPAELVPLKNLLGVEVIETAVPPAFVAI